MQNLSSTNLVPNPTYQAPPKYSIMYPHFMILTVPNKKLHQKAIKVTKFDNTLLKKVDKLRTELKKSPTQGVGLAGPQIGILERFFVVQTDLQKEPEVFINPTIVYASNKTNLDIVPEQNLFMEGCLSIPHTYGLVERPWKIRIKYYDTSGEKYTKEVEGFEATIIQHEYDHLNGVLFTDRLQQQGREPKSMEGTPLV